MTTYRERSQAARTARLLRDRGTLRPDPYRESLSGRMLRALAALGILAALVWLLWP